MNGTNQLAIQGVNYEAQPAGFFAGGSARGAMMMFVSSFSPLLHPCFYSELFSVHSLAKALEALTYLLQGQL